MEPKPHSALLNCINYYYFSIVLYVNGKNFITDITLNDGEWHFICVTWISENGKFEIYIDGNLHDSGTNLSAGMPIEANGTIIVGQEQVTKGKRTEHYTA